MKYYLYIFSCSKGRYVGITSNLHKRKTEHIRKYGEIKFHTIKFFYDRKEAIEIEKDIIERVGTNNLLNKNIQGSCPSNKARRKLRLIHLGKKVSKETKEKISRAHLGKKASDETKKKMSKERLGSKNGFFGKKHSKEAKNKNSKAHLGKKASDETKDRMSIAHKKRWIKRKRKQYIKEILTNIKLEW
jgi:predicted GIY-YIG superfamily endonuclease